MDSKKSSNKIREIVRLQQILKKWKKVAANSSKNPTTTTTTDITTTTTATSNAGGSKSIKFLRKTLSFTETTSMTSSTAMSNDVVPKGFLAVCVGKELKRFIIPMDYLTHQAFAILLREAEEEFGFQQEGVLKIPCEVVVFEKILKMIQQKRDVFLLHEFGRNIVSYGGNDKTTSDLVMGCYSSPELTPRHPQMCR